MQRKEQNNSIEYDSFAILNFETAAFFPINGATFPTTKNMHKLMDE